MGISKSSLNSHDPKIPLLICGHGGDLCDEDGSLEVFDVPKGCVYVTFTTCTLPSRANIIYEKIFSDKNNLVYLKDPIKYQEELETLFGQKIHIHHPDAEEEVSRTYVNSIYGLVGNGGSGKDCWIQLSGINPLSEATFKTLKKTIKESPLLTYDHDCETDVKYLGLKKYYETSILPTYKEVTSLINYLRKKTESKITAQDLFDNFPTITQQDLFEEMPGIYYNPLCRATKCQSINIKKRINQSTRALFKTSNITNNKEEFLKLLTQAIRNCLKKKDCLVYEHLLTKDYDLTNEDKEKIKEELFREKGIKDTEELEQLFNKFFDKKNKRDNNNNNIRSRRTFKLNKKDFEIPLYKANRNGGKRKTLKRSIK